jgi:hypothetical protein
MARIYMVQTKEQYVFLHRVLLDYITAQVDMLAFIFFWQATFFCSPRASLTIAVHDLVQNRMLATPSESRHPSADSSQTFRRAVTTLALIWASTEGVLLHLARPKACGRP